MFCATARQRTFQKILHGTLLPEHQFAGRQSSTGRSVPCFIIVSKDEMAGWLSAAAAKAPAVFGSRTTNFHQATIATTVAPDTSATPMILLIFPTNSAEVRFRFIQLAPRK